MGFLDKAKDMVQAGSLPSFADVISPELYGCKLQKKGDTFLIIGQPGKYEFVKSDVVDFKILVGGGEWCKYKMTLKDGKTFVLLSSVFAPHLKPDVSVMPLEGFFGDLL